MRILAILFTALILYACNDEKKGSSEVSSENKKTEKTVITNPDEEIIISPCAIVVFPTETQMDSMKNLYGEDFYTIADDNSFYVAQAIDFLDSVKTKTIHKDANGLLNFVTMDSKSKALNLNKSLWKIILFNGKTEPKEADITNFVAEYNSYMKD